MIEVRGPNGEVFRFPDGTAPDVMQRALQQHYQSAAPAESAPTPRTMAPPPYFRPEQPAVAAAPQPAASQLGPDSLTPNAFGNTRFMPDTAGRPDLNAALRVAADMERMGQPGGGAVFPGPGPAPHGGQAVPQMAPTMPPGPPLNPNYVPPPPPRLVAQPTNPNLGNEAMFAQQGQTSQGWAGPLEEAMQGAAARQNMNQIVQSRVPPIPEQAPPFAQWVMDNPGTAATLPFAATPIGAWRLGAGLAGNLLRTGTVGAGLGGAAGGIDAAAQGGSPEQIAQGALQGGAFGGAAGAGLPLAAQPIGRAIGGTINAVVNRGANTAPTLDELRTGAQAAYQTAENAGVAIRAAPLQTAVQDIEQAVRIAGLDPTLHPRATAALARLQQLGANGAAGLQEIETIRRVIQGAANSIEPDERRIAGIMVDRLDDFFNNLDPAQVMAGGQPQVAVQALTDARDMWRRFRKGELIDQAIERAQNAVGANYTQAGMLTAIRQQLRMLADPRGRYWRMFTPEEQEMLTQAVRGNATENVLRFVGKFTIRNPLWAAVAGGGAAMGQFWPGAAMLAAEGARAGANRLGMARATDFSDFVRRGGPPVTVTPQVQRIMDALSSAGGRLAAPEADETGAARMIQALMAPVPAPYRPRSVQTTLIPGY